MVLVHKTTEGTKKEVLNVYFPGILPHLAISRNTYNYKNRPSSPENNLGALPPAYEDML